MCRDLGRVEVGAALPPDAAGRRNGQGQGKFSMCRDWGRVEVGGCSGEKMARCL
jgi:hypothetical protein